MRRLFGALANAAFFAVAGAQTLAELAWPLRWPAFWSAMFIGLWRLAH